LTDRTLPHPQPPAGCGRHPRSSACHGACPADASTSLACMQAGVETGDRIRLCPGRKSRRYPDREPVPARASIPGLFSTSTHERRNHCRKSAVPSALLHRTTGRFLCHLLPAPGSDGSGLLVSFCSCSCCLSAASTEDPNPSLTPLRSESKRGSTLVSSQSHLHTFASIC
jgi:hypothetical protein